MSNASTICRGRFAPSPTGGLHLGSALVALIAWLSARSQSGSFVWRVEDIDGPRVVAGAVEQQMEEARWLGLDWDEGPDVGGAHAPYEQSLRSPHYEQALARLAEKRRLFPCAHSRKDLQELASAPHGTDRPPPYPKSLRPAVLDANWFEQYQTRENHDAALRFRVNDGGVTFHDAVYAEVVQNVSEEVGDFVLKRKDGVYAYQLAVVVDDLDMHITEVVRGADLLDSTARQIQLIQALTGVIPTYAHVPLLVNEAGEKLSKRDKSITISELRKAGIQPQAIVGWLAHLVGFLDRPSARTPSDLVTLFDWHRVHSDNIAVSSSVVEQIRQINA
ncbi:MAG: tRNA glutamyl-Q(34) synthetase GluQRS [Rubricoccaceae bacterium]|nr:tRNA glutamyl-Q(34) synthetase GluQRS [Rubricoccaceae bacterium]